MSLGINGHFIFCIFIRSSPTATDLGTGFVSAAVNWGLRICAQRQLNSSELVLKKKKWHAPSVNDYKHSTQLDNSISPDCCTNWLVVSSPVALIGSITLSTEKSQFHVTGARLESVYLVEWADSKGLDPGRALWSICAQTYKYWWKREYKVLVRWENVNEYGKIMSQTKYWHTCRICHRCSQAGWQHRSNSLWNCLSRNSCLRLPIARDNADLKISFRLVGLA